MKPCGEKISEWSNVDRESGKQSGKRQQTLSLILFLKPNLQILMQLRYFHNYMLNSKIIGLLFCLATLLSAMHVEEYHLAAIQS